MITILSPAKNMRRGLAEGEQVLGICPEEIREPLFMEQTCELHRHLKQYQPWELESLMKVNEKLGMQAFVDYQNFDPERKGYPAVMSYDGLVFKNLNAKNFSREDLLEADKRLRILSGFYGVVRPLDGILPYRLEMMCKVRIEKRNLYQFWGDMLYQSLAEEDNIILNLASEEYAKCVRKYLREQDMFIDVEFLADKGGRMKQVTAWAKMARGQMARYIVKYKIEDPEKLKWFEWDGFCFVPELSYERKMVFVKQSI